VKAGVLGSPIAHSLSPALHRAAYAALGLDWTYDAVEVSSDGLAGFVEGLGPEWAGLSLTMPLKQVVLPLLDEVSDVARLTGAANTVVLRDGRREGHNTDVAGIVAALREAGTGDLSRAAVIGAGATAASALVALGIELRVGELHPLELEDRWPQVVISTLPAGAADALAALSDPSGNVPTLLDVVYAPWPTALASVYSAAGGVVVGGAAMLLHQAAAQVELMTGQPAPLDAMRAALL
jgi:shikimate dehydrogenase